MGLIRALRYGVGFAEWGVVKPFSPEDSTAAGGVKAGMREACGNNEETSSLEQTELGGSNGTDLRIRQGLRLGPWLHAGDQHYYSVS